MKIALPHPHTTNAKLKLIKFVRLPMLQNVSTLTVLLVCVIMECAQSASIQRGWESISPRSKRSTRYPFSSVEDWNSVCEEVCRWVKFFFFYVWWWKNNIWQSGNLMEWSYLLQLYEITFLETDFYSLIFVCLNKCVRNYSVGWALNFIFVFAKRF